MTPVYWHCGGFSVGHCEKIGKKLYRFSTLEARPTTVYKVQPYMPAWQVMDGKQWRGKSAPAVWVLNSTEVIALFIRSVGCVSVRGAASLDSSARPVLQGLEHANCIVSRQTA